MIRFPSLESYMSVVVLGHICLSAGSLWMILGSVALTFLIGFSRVYSQVGNGFFAYVQLSMNVHMYVCKSIYVLVKNMNVCISLYMYVCMYYPSCI